MTPDKQEALSKRYGTEVFSVLILKSNNIAVFGHHKKLLGIFESADAAMECGCFQPAYQPPTQSVQRTKPTVSIDTFDTTLEELGL